MNATKAAEIKADKIAVGKSNAKMCTCSRSCLKCVSWMSRATMAQCFNEDAKCKCHCHEIDSRMVESRKRARDGGYLPKNWS